MLPISNLINQVFLNAVNWEVYNQRFSASIPVDRVTGANQTQIGYWSDSQLWQTIAWSRFAYERNPIVKGVLNILCDHIGKPTVTWIGNKDIVKRVTRLWERFATTNCFGETGYLSRSEIAQDREREMRVRWLRDGEVFLRFFVNDSGYPLSVRFVEPEQVRTPPVSEDEKYSHTWGIVTDKDDYERIVGYWVFYPQSGKWDFVHRRYIVYGRRNADRNIKRGLPEIANLELDFSYLWSLLRSVAITSKAQASIAWVEKFPGALAEQIISSSLPLRSDSPNVLGPLQPGQPNQTPSFYGIDPNAKNLDAGTILATNQGKEYEPGPTSDPGKYLEACSTLLHLLSLQWCLPDWITKGPEAYASALVNGSPFARRIEALQEEYAAVYGQVAMSFLRLMAYIGKIERKVLSKVRPSVKLPRVVVADEQKQVDLLQRELEAGLLSEIEYLQSRGRSPQKTLAQRKQWQTMLREYGLEEKGEEREEEKKTKRDEPSPPGSKLLTEETCPKKDFLVFDSEENKCVTVNRCSSWEPQPGSRYQKSGNCRSDHEGIKSKFDHIFQNCFLNKIRGIRKKITETSDPKLLSKLHSCLGSVGSRLLVSSQLNRLFCLAHHEEQGELNQGYKNALKALLESSYAALGMNYQHSDSLEEMGVSVFRLLEVVQSESDERVGKVASKLIGELSNSIWNSISSTGDEKQALKVDNKHLKRFLGNHDFFIEGSYLGKLIALGSITSIDQQEKRAIQDSLAGPVLRSVLSSAPYEAAKENMIAEGFKNFAFENMITVNDKNYREIINHLNEMNSFSGEEKVNIAKLLLVYVAKNCPNAYGSTSRNKEIEYCIEKAIASLDGQTAVGVANAIAQRCLLAYGTADVARRYHEELWEKVSQGAMPQNPEFPIADLTLAKMKGDEVVISPASLKMHLTDKSDSFNRVFGDAEKFIEKAELDNWRQEVDQGLRDILSKSIENLEGTLNSSQSPRDSLSEALSALSRNTNLSDCQHVNWNDKAQAKKCFVGEMIRMALIALGKMAKNQDVIIEKLFRAIKDGKFSVTDFAVIRMRAEKVEWKVGKNDQVAFVGYSKSKGVSEAWKAFCP